MHLPHRPWIWLWAILPLAACIAGLWLTPFSLLPRYALAKSHWDDQGIRHYRLTAQLSQGANMSGPWTVEIRDDQVIAGFDTLNGALLDGTQLLKAQRFYRSAPCSAQSAPRSIRRRSHRHLPCSRALRD